MAKLKYAFKGKKLLRNDDIYNHPAFPIKDSIYEFLITPKCKYWRFGLRFSESENVHYNSGPRREDPSFPDIIVAVGSREGTIWSNENRLELTHYYFKGHDDHVLKRFNTYITQGEVKLQVSHVPDNILRVEIFFIGSDKKESYYKADFVLNSFKYFKISAWSDGEEYDLDCEIKVNEPPSPPKEDKRTYEFTMGNVTFRHGDIFDDAVFNITNAIVFPASTSGTANKNVIDFAERFRMPLPQNQPTSLITAYPLNVDGKGLLGVWAYSVEGKVSNQYIIKNLCQNLIRTFEQNEISKANLPMLGTGAGNLDYITVAKIYLDVFNETKSNTHYYVSVLNLSTYMHMRTYVYNVRDSRPDREALPEDTNNGNEELGVDNKPFSKSNILFRDKNSIDGVIGVKALASELRDIILKMPEEQGRMLGIFGKWGRGKTFLMNEIWNSIKDVNGIQRVEFHAWKYQDTPAVYAYLYEQFASAYYNSASNRWYKFWRRIKLNLTRLGPTEVIFFVLSFGTYCYWAFGLTFEEKKSFLLWLVSTLTVGTILYLFIIYFRYGKAAQNIFGKYYSKVSFSNHLGLQSEVQNELKYLLKSWGNCIKNHLILLFVDDIDRCSEGKIIQIVDALRVMLEDEEISKNIIVITAIDERILKRVIKSKYKDLVQLDDTEQDKKRILLDRLANEYIDKLFISGIKLGDLSDEERDEFFIELTKNDRVEGKMKHFESDEVSENKEKIETEGSQAKETSNKSESSNEDEKADSSEEIAPDESEGDLPVNGVKQAKAIVEKREKLSIEEIELIRECLKKYKNSTPRQVRIFYYRYLIAKNLLIRQYAKGKRKNIWLIPEFSKILICLIILYSDMDDHNIVTEHKINIQQFKSAVSKVYLLEGAEIETLDYRELLKVLDIVIAY